MLMAETPIIVNGVKSLVYDLGKKYELHILEGKNLTQTQICNVVYYNTHLSKIRIQTNYVDVALYILS